MMRWRACWLVVALGMGLAALPVRAAASGGGSVPRGVPGTYVTSEGDMSVADAGEGRLRVRISVVSGPSADLCDFDETLLLTGTKATFRAPDGEGPEDCVLTLRFARDSVSVEQAGACDCGDRARMGGTYLRRGSFKGAAPHPARGAALERLEMAEQEEIAGLHRLERMLEGPRDGQRRSLLASAEGHFMAFRAANADFQGDNSRGTPWGEVLTIMAREEASARRARHLMEFLAQTGADPDVADVAEFRARLARVDERLNQAYRALRDRRDATGKRKLLLAQRAWLRYRDAQASFEAERWGHGQAEFRLMCLERLTTERCLQLETWSGTDADR